MIRQLLIATLIWPLMCAWVEARESKAYAYTKAAAGFHLKGVLISRSGRSALVNGTVAREGDRVGGATILQIGEGEVRVLVKDPEIIMSVGSMVDQANQPAMPLSSLTYHAVKRGETLSGIAVRVLRDGVTLHQMMIALYRANPEAFSGNMDVLHEGAILRIPDEFEISRLGSGLATVFNRATAPRHDTAYATRSCRVSYPTLCPNRRSERPTAPGMPSPC